jgi:DNA-binding XRE family transcriptional regulator
MPMARTLLSAAKVKQYRDRLGLQQKQAAKLAGWQRGQSWHKLETQNADVRISTLATVARVLHCKIDDLLVSVPGESKSAGRYSRIKPGLSQHDKMKGGRSPSNA